MDIASISHVDHLQLLELGKDMHAESVYKDLDYDYTKLMEIGNHLDRKEDGWFGVRIKLGHEIVAFFIGYETPYFFSQDRIAQELLLYVKPQYRGSSYAIRLIKAFEKWAKSIGVKKMLMSTSTKVKEEQTMRLFEKLGYTHAGHLYEKGV